MVNTDDFIKRLEIVLDYYSISGSAFADKIGVQRSSLSHLLSGRNKPSLDFVLKIIEVFPEVDLYWVLIGKGNFPKSESVNQTPVELSPTPTPTNQSLFEQDLFSEKISTPEPIKENEVNDDFLKVLKVSNSSQDVIDKIVIFFKDDSFKIYNPR